MRNSLLLIGLGLVLLSAGLSFWAYPQLPHRVPTHWDLTGHINGYSSRAFTVAFMPAMAAVIWVMMIVLPGISPRGYRLDGAATAFYEAMIATIALFVAVQFIILRAAITQTAPSIEAIFALIGALMAVLGILIVKVPKNFFMGIRTPWTLASDEVWRKTNRLGGRLMVVAGVILIVCSPFVNVAVGALIALIVAIVSVPLVYSYVLYRRIEG